MGIRTTMLATALLALGCGNEANDGAAAVETSQAELTAACPTKPTPYNAGLKLYPDTSSSATTVYMQDPTNAAYFYAYGFDTKKNVCAFFVRGSIRAELVKLQVDVSSNIASIENNNPTSLDNTTVSQVGKPPAPPWPGGTEDLARKLATRVFDASVAPY